MSAGAGDNSGAMTAGLIGQLADEDETELSKHTHACREGPTHVQKHTKAGGETWPSTHNGIATSVLWNAV